MPGRPPFLLGHFPLGQVWQHIRLAACHRRDVLPVRAQGGELSGFPFLARHGAVPPCPSSLLSVAGLDAPCRNALIRIRAG